MINKMLMFFAIIIISLLAISGVSASEIDDSINEDFISDIDTNVENLEIGDEEIENKLPSSVFQLDDVSDNEDINADLNKESLKFKYSSEAEVLTDDSSEGSFKDLSMEINNAGNTLVLTRNYTFSEGDSNLKNGIRITKAITIIGKGYTINGKNMSRIFDISCDSVSLNRIYFINFNLTSDNNPGGAIYCKGRFLSIHDCTFENCTASFGGAISLSGSYGSIYNSTFINCKANDIHGGNDGGAISFSGDNGNIDSCYFFNCSATDEGGAIFCTANYDSVYNCSFMNCSSGNGGAIKWTRDYGGGKNGSVYNCSFIKCSNSWGSAINWDGVNGRVFNSNFVNCSAPYGSGTICWNNVGGSVYDCSFINCSAEYGAGAIHWYVDNGTVYNCTFVNCKSGLKKQYIMAGAISWYAHRGSVYDCSFINCSAECGAGAISWDGINGTIFNCSFFNCTSKQEGGSIYFFGEPDYSENSSVYNCSFINCNANLGGAIYGYGHRVTNCMFVNNSAKNGGATFNITVIDCNFTNNIVTTSGGAMYKGNATNSTFLLNFAPTGGTEDIYETYTEDCTFIIPTLCVSNFNSTYDSGDKLLFNLIYEEKIFDGYNITLTVYKDDNVIGTYFGLSGEGWIVNLPPNTYKAILNLENSNVGPVNVSLDIKLAPTTIKSENLITTYKNYDELVVTLENPQGKPIEDAILSIDLIGLNNYTTDSKGQIKISTSVLPANTYTATITFDGNEFYEGSSSTAMITVNKINTKIMSVAETINLFVEDHSKIEYNLNPTDAVGDITFVSSNPDVVTVNSTGEIEALSEGSSTITISFSGSSNYEATNATVNVKIAKKTTQIIVSDLTTTYNTNGYLVITLMDGGGSPLSGVKVSVYLNDINNFTTDYNGQIKILTKDLVPKIYTVTIIFTGNNIYYESSTTAKVIINKINTNLTVPKITATYNVNKYLVVTLNDSSGNLLVNKIISVKVGTIIKNVTTNAQGQVSVLISKLVPKTYTASISFAGDSYYDKSSTTASVVVKKATPKLTSKAKTFKRYVKTKKYTITLKNNKGVVMKNTKVTLTVNKKTYSVKTNSKGVATFKITNLKKKGKFTAVVKYAGSKYYNKVTKKLRITIKA